MQVPRSRTRLLIAMAALLAAILLGFGLGISDLRDVLLVYLATWLFVLGAVLGSACFLLIHALTGGEWGIRLGRAWVAAIRLFPWVALFILPLLAGASSLFTWLGHAQISSDPNLAQQRWYLNGVGLVARTVVNLAIWWWLLRSIDHAMHRKRISAARAALGILVLLITITVAATDWVMSLVPSWHSTDIGLQVISADLVVALAVAMIVSLRGAYIPTSSSWVKDMGNLLLVAVLGWAYISFMDYLTTWIADQPPEIAWYLPRMTTNWWHVAIVLMMLGLIAPFFALINGSIKRSPSLLRVLAWIVLAAQWLNVVWLVLPGLWKLPATWISAPLVSIGLLGVCALRYRQLFQRRRAP